MRFIAVDLETANPRMSSICQIGIVAFEDGREVGADVRLVDPRDYFDPYNVAVHGITEADVRGAPRFSDLHGWLCQQTGGQIVACHTHFDGLRWHKLAASTGSKRCPATGLIPRKLRAELGRNLLKRFTGWRMSPRTSALNSGTMTHWRMLAPLA